MSGSTLYSLVSKLISKLISTNNHDSKLRISVSSNQAFEKTALELINPDLLDEDYFDNSIDLLNMTEDDYPDPSEDCDYIPLKITTYDKTTTLWIFGEVLYKESLYVLCMTAKDIYENNGEVSMAATHSRDDMSSTDILALSNIAIFQKIPGVGDTDFIVYPINNSDLYDNIYNSYMQQELYGIYNHDSFE